MPLGTEVGSHSVLHGESQLPLPKKGQSHSIFGSCLLWSNGWMDQDGTWHGVGLSPGHIVLDRVPAPLPKTRGRGPQFLAHFYCGQTAGCIQMPLGMEVGLGPGRIVLDKDLVLLPKKGAQPHFSAHVYCGLTAVCIRIPLGMAQPKRHCVRWGPSSPPLKGHSPPIFGPCLLWPNSWMD